MFSAIAVKNCVERRDSHGGTSPASTDVEITLSMQDSMRREEDVRMKDQLIQSCWDKLLNE